MCHMCDPVQACDELGGNLQPDGSCVWDTRKHTAIPACRGAVSSRVATDEYGACYSFMVKEDGGVRERYRFTDGECNARFPAFKEMSGMCSLARGWPTELGAPLAPPDPSDACAKNLARDTCEASQSHCSWNGERKTLSCHEWPSDDGTTTEGMGPHMCKAMCASVGGDFDAKTASCSLPACLKASY